MSDFNLSVQQQKQLNNYLKQNPKISRKQAIEVLFMRSGHSPAKGVSIERTSKNEMSLNLPSGRKVVVKGGNTYYYAADGVELKPQYFIKKEGNIDIRPSGRYSITKNGKTKYYAADGTELKAAYFQKVENPDVIIKTSKGKTYNFNKTLANRINNVSVNLKKAEDENGFIGSAWSGFKNLTGIGDSSDKVRELQDREKKLFAQFNSNSKTRAKVFKQLTGYDYNKQNLEKFINGQISLQSEKALAGYKEGQDMAVDVAADVVSGVAAVGIYTAAVAAAPFTGGGSIAVGVAAAAGSGALIKTGVKYADAKSGGREYTLDDIKHDASTGAVSGTLAPVTAGLGGAVGKTVATKLGIQAVKTAGKEVAEESVKTGVKQSLKTALTNPAGYEYIGGNAVKRVAAYGTEMAADGAIGGGVDNAFRTAYDGGSLQDVVKAAGEGFVGGALLSPLIGGGIKSSNKLLSGALNHADNSIEFSAVDVETVMNKIKQQFGTNSDYDKGAVERLSEIINSDNASFVNSALDVIKTRQGSNYSDIHGASGYITHDNQEFAQWVLSNKDIAPSYWKDILKNANEATIPEFKTLLKDKNFAKKSASNLQHINSENIDLYKKYYNDKRFRYNDTMLINMIAFTNKYNRNFVTKALEQFDPSDKELAYNCSVLSRHITSVHQKQIVDKLLPSELNKLQTYNIITLNKILDNTSERNVDLLIKNLNTGKFSLTQILSLSKISDIDINTRMTLLEKNSFLKTLNSLSPDMRKVLSEDGIDLGALEKFLKSEKVDMPVTKEDKSEFLKNLIANNNENRILNTDFSNTSNPEVKEILDLAATGIPAFEAIADTKGLKTLQTLQSAMNSQEYKSFSDLDKTICKFSILLSDLDCEPEIILKNYNLGDTANSRIINILKNRHLLSGFLDGNISDKAVVANFRNFSDYKTAEFLLKTNPAYANKFADESLKKIETTFDEFYSNQKYLFTSHILKNGENFPKEIYKGEQVKVLNLNLLANNEDLSKYGFVKGTTPDNVVFNVHMVKMDSNATHKIEKMLLLGKDQYNDFAPSSTPVKGRYNPTFYNFKFGVILNNENMNIATFGYDTATGNYKDGRRFVDLLFYNDSNELNRNEFLNSLKEHNIILSKEEYVELTKQLQAKKYMNNIKDVKIGNKVIKAEYLQEAINKCVDTIVGNEVTSFNPRVEALYAKVGSLKDCPFGFVELAQKYNLPIILASSIEDI